MRKTGLWWAAVVLGLVSAGLWKWQVVGEFEANLLITSLAIVPWVGLALAWKWPGVGGILLIGTFAMSFWAAFSNSGLIEDQYYQDFVSGFVVFFAAFSALVSGILFLMSGWGRPE